MRDIFHDVMSGFIGLLYQRYGSQLFHQDQSLKSSSSVTIIIVIQLGLIRSMQLGQEKGKLIDCIASPRPVNLGKHTMKSSRLFHNLLASKRTDIVLIVLIPIFCILGYNVPTWAFPSFGLKIVSWFDASVKAMIPFLDHELKLDNSKV